MSRIESTTTYHPEIITLKIILIMKNQEAFKTNDTRGYRSWDKNELPRELRSQKFEESQNEEQRGTDYK